MKKAVQTPNIVILLILLLFTALPVIAAGQNIGESKSRQPVTMIDLGIPVTKV